MLFEHPTPAGLALALRAEPELLSPGGRPESSRLEHAASLLDPTEESGAHHDAVQVNRLRAMFTDLLGCGPVPPDGDFFALGGHSLLASRLTNRIRHEFGFELSMTALFEDPTPLGIANRVACGSVPRLALRPRLQISPTS